MRIKASEMLVETGGWASPHFTAARYFGCFNGAVQSVSTHTGTQETFMIMDSGRVERKEGRSSEE